MALEPVKIPANVYVEERIIGPVTFRQIIIMLIGSGISYAIWSAVKAAGDGKITLMATVLSWIPAMIAAAFAFVKINDISLVRMCFLLIERMQKPSVRTWQPRSGITINIALTVPKAKVVEAAPSERRTRERIEELTRVLDASIAAPTTPIGAHREQPAEAAEEERIPVRPGRVAASPLETPVDTIKQPEAEEGPLSLLTDLFRRRPSP